MGKVGFLALCALALFFASGAVGAYVLNVTVEDGLGTKLYNTKVEVYQGNTLASSASADRDGNAVMELGAGTYFIKPVRSPYPDQVVPVIIKESTQIKIVMNLKRETGTAYGQVSDSEANWEGKNIYLLSDWKIVASAKILPGGYFVLPYLSTQAYGIRLDSGAFSLDQNELMLGEREARYLDLHVVHPKVEPEAQVTLTAPKIAEKSSPIVAVLMKGDVPLSGQKITISTPAGMISATTNEAGRVSVNAAGYGDYIFTYGDLTAKTSLPKPASEIPTIEQPTPQAPAQEQPTSPTIEQKPPATETAKPAQQNDGMIVLGFAAVAIIIIFGALGAGMLLYHKIGKAGSPPKEEKAAEEKAHHAKKAHHHKEKK